MMEWVYYIALAGTACVAALFVSLYTAGMLMASDDSVVTMRRQRVVARRPPPLAPAELSNLIIVPSPSPIAPPTECDKRMWPPCVSELMEDNKPLFIICFGFTAGMAWLNLVFIGLLHHSEALVGYATAVFFAIMGIMAFDLHAHWCIHHVFVALYIAASLAYSNTLRVDWVAWCVNATTAIFGVLTVARTMIFRRWTPWFKLSYTALECLWVASFFFFMIVNAAVCKPDYGALLLLDAGGALQHARPEGHGGGRQR